MKNSIVLIIAFVVYFISCGGDRGGGVINNAGTGSLTLKVEATISAKEEFSGAKEFEDFTTDIVIKIWDAQQEPVVDAKVTVNAGGRELIIQHDKNGIYKATAILGYSREYRIDIIRNSDSVGDVIITGPEIHTIKIGNPADSPTTVKASDSVTVLWSPYGYATRTEIETKNFKETVADSGTYTIPKGNFEVSVYDYIRITREKSLNPAGAIAGSIITVKVRNRLDPITVIE